jgi:hypothetical protein
MYLVSPVSVTVVATVSVVCCLDSFCVVRCQHRAKARAALAKDVRAAVGALHFETRAFLSDDAADSARFDTSSDSDGDAVHGRGGDDAPLPVVTITESVRYAATVHIQAGMRGRAVRRKFEVRRRAQRRLATVASWAAWGAIRTALSGQAGAARRTAEVGLLSIEINIASQVCCRVSLWLYKYVFVRT